MTERLCAVSVDLDEIAEYRAIHGLPSADAGADGLVYRVALERFARLAESERLPLTLFAVGRDLAEPAHAAALRALCVAGHVVESHSHEHRYDLSQLSVASIRADVARARERIVAVTGRTPAGFRAPGYLVSAALYDALEAEGVAWSSSVFPCPPYYLAKLVAMAALRFGGRASRALVDSPLATLAPREPHRPEGRRLLELPIAVTAGPRLPFIGTALSLAGPRGARWLTRALGAPRFVNLELHGIDLLDHSDGLPDLARAQPDLWMPLSRKLAALQAALTALRAGGYRFVTVDAAARSF